MKKIAFFLLSIPLLAQSHCLEADRQAFLRNHAPALTACEPAANRLCLDHPRPVDDVLFRTVVDPHPLFFPEVGEDQVARWPHERVDANAIVPRQPPGTFMIVDDALRLDLTRRTVFVSCDGTQVYLRDSGGFNHQRAWYGPIPLATLAGLKARRD